MADLPAVLVVDDEIRSLETLRRTLEEDFAVHTASDGAAALDILEREAVQVVLTDQRMPDMSGVELLRRVRHDWPDLVRIIISGYTDSEDIIAGINEAGIYQYLLKPWHPEQLLLTIRRAAELHRLQGENRRLALELRTAEPALRRQVGAARTQVRQAFSPQVIVRAPDSPMNALCDLVARAARYDLAILLSGESGTGKELLARAIHYGSGRADRAFVVENCGALPDTLLESELFGHKKGAFTGAVSDRPGRFQEADGGTLFLDEIGETTPAFQVKLLRVLQEGEIRPLGSHRCQQVDVRVIAATNRDLKAEVAAGRFREDLYYRLATVPLQVPPLRDRPMDIPLLAEGILNRAAQRLGRPVDGLSPEVLSCLQAYPWAGNVRELMNEIQRMLALSDSPILGVELLAPQIRLAGRAYAAEHSPAKPQGAGGLRAQVDSLESRMVRAALERNGGNISRTAEELGLSRLGLRKKMARLGLT